MQSVTATQTSRKNGFRSLLVETLENRQLCAVDYADAIDVVRSTAMLKNVESAVIRTGRTQTVTVSGSLSSTQQQDHSFLEKVNVPGSFTADVTIRLEKNVLVEQFNVRNTFTGRSQLDDIDLAAIAADVSVRGTYRVSVANRAPSRVLSADWRSEGTANVTILSGPARGSDYTLTLLVTDGREYGDKLSGLSTSELVGNSVRNAVPVKTPLANWAGEVLQRAEKLRIPNNDFQKALSNYRIVADLFSSAGSRTNDQIYQDLLKSKSFVVGIQSESDLLRFAQGGVTTIVGAKFSLQRSWDQVITNIPIVNNAPLFGGLVTASVGAEASLGVSVTLAGVFAADSRGWGFSEGTAATLELRLEALLKGSVAIIGIDRWSLIGVDVKAGAFINGKLRVAVGSLSANPEQLRHGAILYVTANNVQRGTFNSYLSASLSAEVGAVLKSKVSVVGFTVWKKKLEKSWEVYRNTITVPQRSLRQ